MDLELRALVAERLAGDEMADESVSEFVLSALAGGEALDAVLAGDEAEEAEEKAGARPAPAGAYLTSISVEGFRGVGERASLELLPGPGLTLVVGRNGSGKSSFAEGLEVLLTGDNLRWSKRSAIWRDGWRNLHHASASLEAGLAVEGRAGATTVRRSWADDAALEESEAEVQPTGGKKTSLETLGWSEGLISFRPFLSYNELGSMLDEGPSKLHDAVASVLGLEELSAADKALRDARLERERDLKQVLADRNEIVETLEGFDDDRAAACRTALRGKQLDPEAVAEAIGVTGAAPEGSEIGALKRVLGVELPAAERISSVVAKLRAATAELTELAGTQADELLRSAELLELALGFRIDFPSEACPVCETEGVIDEEWRERAATQAELQRAAGVRAQGARSRLEAAQRDGRALAADFPQALRAVESILDIAPLLDLWRRWAAMRDEVDPARLADGLESIARPLAAALEELKAAANEDLRRREDRWRPIGTHLAQWLPRARAAMTEAAAVPRLKAAEAWLKKEAVTIRNERFAPIADEAGEIWRLLRQRSNVQLGRIELKGTGTQRRVSLDVTVDGVSGAALGVMSQGELHALALSLFFPRATLPESPFRFVVIDDPVQSMDPAKVDGLARVLDRAAQDRQVLVFTHDDRLPEAIRRLRIDARVIELARKEESVIEMRDSLDPVERHIADARAVASTSGLPDHVARRVVGGFCRLAVEAGCVAAVRRRRIGRGDPHAEVEATIAGATRLTSYAALAIFDDKERGGDVLPRIHRDYGSRSANTFQEINKGTHEALTGDLHDLIRDAAILARGLEQAA